MTIGGGWVTRDDMYAAAKSLGLRQSGADSDRMFHLLCGIAGAQWLETYNWHQQRFGDIPIVSQETRRSYRVFWRCRKKDLPDIVISANAVTFALEWARIARTSFAYSGYPYPHEYDNRADFPNGTLMRNLKLASEIARATNKVPGAPTAEDFGEVAKLSGETYMILDEISGQSWSDQKSRDEMLDVSPFIRHGAVERRGKCCRLGEAAFNHLGKALCYEDDTGVRAIDPADRRLLALRSFSNVKSDRAIPVARRLIDAAAAEEIFDLWQDQPASRPSGVDSAIIRVIDDALHKIDPDEESTPNNWWM